MVIKVNAYILQSLFQNEQASLFQNSELVCIEIPQYTSCITVNTPQKGSNHSNVTHLQKVVVKVVKYPNFNFIRAHFSPYFALYRGPSSIEIVVFCIGKS
eukprot:gb/GECG01008549.1/.p1 GENE.gb/GECG01008549.1/~~gb/GECG01008549.1/.p1  ORF type:complete len:100 (+),score=6.62 gb/GECG01008549.1/:1-300(+)